MLRALLLPVLLLLLLPLHLVGQQTPKPTLTAADSALLADDVNWDTRFGRAGFNSDVQALLVLPNGDIIAGGAFTDVGGDIVADHIARWDGTDWHALGTGLNDKVQALLRLPNGDIVAGGRFSEAGGVPARSVARWDGSRWHPMGEGLGSAYRYWDSEVHALALGKNGDLWAGGKFYKPVGQPESGAARWDGTEWSRSGDAPFGEVRSLAVAPNGDVVVGGDLALSERAMKTESVMRWDGKKWHQIDEPEAHRSNSYLHISHVAVAPNGDIWASGQVNGTKENSQEYKSDCVMRWDGTKWRVPGTGFERLSFENGALKIGPKGEVLIGGELNVSSTGTKPSYGILRWDGKQLQPSPCPVKQVQAIAVAANGDLIIAGYAPNVGRAVVRWNGQQMQVFETRGKYHGRLDLRHCAALPNGDFVAIAQLPNFSNSYSYPGFGIARLSGNTWQPLSDSASCFTEALAVTPGGDVLAADWVLSPRSQKGYPDFIGSQILRWHGRKRQVVGPMLNGSISGIGMLPNGDILAAGSFTDASDDPAADYIARWDGTRWRPFGEGLQEPVTALAVSSTGEVMITGYRKHVVAGDTEARNFYVARSDGHGRWQALGPDFPQVVHTLVFLPSGDVVAGGAFTHLNGQPTANHVARWDGSHWRPLGTGLNTDITKLAVAPNGLLLAAGNKYYPPEGAPSDSLPQSLTDRLPVSESLVCWDGTSWRILGTGLNGDVSDMVVAPDGRVAVVGNFSTSGSGRRAMAGFGIYRFPSSVPMRPLVPVRKLPPLPVVKPQPQPTRPVAVAADRQWDRRFAPPGFNGTVVALVAAPNGDLVAAGNFTAVSGDTAANYIARWDGHCWRGLATSPRRPVDAFTVAPNGDVIISYHIIEQYGYNGGVERSSTWFARWDGRQWAQLPTGYLSANVNAMAVAPNGDLLIGGRFRSIGGNQQACNLARWNGVHWAAVGDRFFSDEEAIVSLAALPTGELLALSDFWNGHPANAGQVACWKEGKWQNLASDTLVQLKSFARGADGQLIGRAVFKRDAYQPDSMGFVRWEGGKWVPFQVPWAPAGVSPSESPPYALTAKGEVVALFSPLRYLRDKEDSGMNNIIFGDIASYSPSNEIALWTGTRWQPLENADLLGLSNTVTTLAIAPSGEVWVGGRFGKDADFSGGRNGLLRWKQNQWEPMGSGFAKFLTYAYLRAAKRKEAYNMGYRRRLRQTRVNQPSQLVVTPDGKVFLWGVGTGLEEGFGFDPGVEDDYPYLVTRQDTSWQAVESFNKLLAALMNRAPLPDEAGLPPQQQYAVSCRRVRKKSCVLLSSKEVLYLFNGTRWQKLPLPTKYPITAATLELSGTAVLVADLNGHISRWDGQQWLPFTEYDGIQAMDIAPNGDLLVGGKFSKYANNPYAGTVLRWDGQQWQPLGSGLNGDVDALAVAPNGDVYVGGKFTATGNGLPMSHFGIFHAPELVRPRKASRSKKP